MIYEIVLLLAAEAAQPTMPTSMNEAAVLALGKAYNEHPHYYEYGGVIVKRPDGTFNPSSPSTGGHADHLMLDEDFESYEGGFPVAATYHTHPCIKGYVPGVFSPADLKGAREALRPAYVLDECTGDVHYWEPGMPYDKPRSLEDLIGGIEIAVGKIVGHIPVDGKELSL